MSDITFITDRTNIDLNRIKTIRRHILDGTATASELAEWNSGTSKGAINLADLNRWETAIDFICRYGYYQVAFTKKTWTYGEKMMKTDTERLRQAFLDLRNNAYYVRMGTVDVQRARSFFQQDGYINPYSRTPIGANAVENYIGRMYDYFYSHRYIPSIENIGWASGYPALLTAINELPNGTYKITEKFTLTSVSGTSQTTALCGTGVYKIVGGVWTSILETIAPWTSAVTVGTSETRTKTFTIDDSNRGSATNIYNYSYGDNSVGQLSTSTISDVKIEKLS